MITDTGKGGKYRYCKCSSRIINLAKGSSCQSKKIPMEKLDHPVPEAVANRVFTPGRVEAMMKKLQHNLKNSRSDHAAQLKKPTKNGFDKATNRSALRGSGKRALTSDSTLQERVHKHQT